jgi:hypothetical protein
MNGPSLAAHCRRSAARRGNGRAVIAVIALGHSVRVALSPLRTREHPAHELGAQDGDEHDRDHVQRRLVHRLERRGFALTRAALPAPS